jgi:hypothetical protein
MILARTWLAVLLAALSLTLACGTFAAAPSPDRLVPETATLIAEIQVERILQDPDLRSLYESAPKEGEQPQTLDEALNLALEKSGIDFRNFQSVVLFSDLSQGEDYLGIIARGQFEEEKVIAALEAEAGAVFTTTEYQGVTVRVAENDPDTPALVFLDSATLVAGSLPAVEAVIDVSQGNLPAISGKVQDTFTNLGSPMFRMALTISPEALANLDDSMGDGMGFAPAINTAIQNLDVVAILADKDGEIIQFRTDLEFTNAESATQVGEMISGFISLMSGFSPDPTMTEILNKLDIDVVDTRITVNFQATVSEMQAYAQSMGNGIAGFDP